MKLPGKLIRESIKAALKKEVAAIIKKGVKPHLTTILVGEAAEQLSFVAIKRKLAEELGIEFQLIHLRKPPHFQQFANYAKEEAHKPTVHGIIVQQPLPVELQTDSVYNFIPDVKEIEGHKPKSPFLPPIGLAVLTGLKYCFHPDTKEYLVDTQTDLDSFKHTLKHKKIVLMGRGITGGLPIGKTLSSMKINYVALNSKAHQLQAQEFLQQADIIITAVGKKVVDAASIKPGVILLNLGLRKEGETLVGDFDEKEISDTAGFYTATPEGLGPIDVLYLYKNLIDATKLQMEKT